MDRILIVLREGLGLNFEAMRPALQVGAAVAIGRGGAVIDRVVDGDVFEAQRPAVSHSPGEQGFSEGTCRWNPSLDAAVFAQKFEQHLSERAEALYAEKVVPLRPSIFDVITGTAGATGDGSGAQLPPLEEHHAQIERVAADLREHGPDRAILKPCAHCGGPPVPFVQLASQGFGAAPRMDSYGEDGLSVEAFVYCHECGATGPMFAEDIFDASDYDQALAEGVRLWQDRDGRHADLYEANAELNVFPRPDMEVTHD